MKKDLWELSIEISQVSDAIIGLTLQYDEGRMDRLTPEVMRGAMLCAAKHLDRISEDISAILEQKGVKSI